MSIFDDLFNWRLKKAETGSSKPVIIKPVLVTHRMMATTTIKMHCPCCDSHITIQLPISGESNKVVDQPVFTFDEEKADNG